MNILGFKIESCLEPTQITMTSYILNLTSLTFTQAQWHIDRQPTI